MLFHMRGGKATLFVDIGVNGLLDSLTLAEKLGILSAVGNNHNTRVKQAA